MFLKYRKHVALPLLAVGFFTVIWYIYGSALRNDFLFFDDTIYVLQDPRVTAGFTAPNLIRILIGSYDLNWHPLTTFSFLLSYEFHGFHAGKFLAFNLIAHAFNGILVFVLLREFSKSFWKSFGVAILFVVHPMHVESVAWITERKDVLSTLFALLALIAYVHGHFKKKHIYTALCFLFFVLSLLSKPMLVTLPLILVLLDMGPLETVKDIKDFFTSVAKKGLYWIFAAGLIAIAYRAQTINHAIVSLEELSLRDRALAIPIHYADYLYRTFWPVNLGIFYEPYSAGLINLYWAPCLILMLWITVAAFSVRKSVPFFLFGWLWFVVVLLPVIGIVKAGPQPIADRYTYFAHIGLFIVVVFSAERILKSFRFRNRVFVLLLLMSAAGLAWRANRQVSYWENGGVLATHTLSFQPQNEAALRKAAKYYQMVEKDYSKAAGLFGKALVLNPDDPALLLNVMDLLMRSGNYSQVIQVGRAFLPTGGKYAHPYWMMGQAAEKRGDLDGARNFYREALKINADHQEAQNALQRLESAALSSSS